MLAAGLPVVVSAALVAGAHAFEPGDPRRLGGPTDVREWPSPDPSVLRVAGDGAAVPLVRALARVFEKAHPDRRIEIFPSIGTSGGIQAVLDGAIDVGLASRRLGSSEARIGLVEHALARTAVVLATNASVKDERIGHAALRDLVRGGTVRWQDGRRVVFFAREKRAPTTRALERQLPALADALDEVSARSRWRIVHHDDEMEEALSTTPASAGLHDLGAIRIQELPLHVVFIDGEDPAAPSYSSLVPLSLLTHGAPRGLAADFLEFARSDAGRRIARAGGYVP